MAKDKSGANRADERTTAPDGAEKKLVEQSRPSRLTVSDLRALRNPPAWLHAAAEVIHGWREHEHAFARPIRLTGADYDAALKAAERPNARGHYEPHAPALSAALARRNS